MPATTNEPAALSIPMPQPALDRLEAAAAARGETVQGLVGALVDRFLAEEARRAPELGAVLETLREGAPSLRERGVRRLWVCGPVARGGARPGPGVDLLCEFAQGSRASLVTLASLRAELSALLGAPVGLGLAEQRGATPRPAAAACEAAGRDAVRAF